jgi:hypothetical protein
VGGELPVRNFAQTWAVDEVNGAFMGRLRKELFHLGQTNGLELGVREFFENDVFISCIKPLFSSMLDEIGKFRLAHAKTNVAASSLGTFCAQRTTYAAIELHWEPDDLFLSSLQSVYLNLVTLSLCILCYHCDVWSKLNFIIAYHLIRKTFVVEVEVDMGFIPAHLAVADWLNLDLVSDHGICVFKPIYVFIKDVCDNLSVWNDPLEGEVV